jgi:hypothetical protein
MRESVAPSSGTTIKENNEFKKIAVLSFLN